MVKFAKTLARKWRSALNGRLSLSSSSVTREAFTNASISSGRASTSFGSPAGYGTGAELVPERESTGNTPKGEFGLGRTEMVSVRRVAHGPAAAVTFDKSIEARSERID